MIAPPKPPANDELEALIKEARERQLRRRLLGAAGIAIAAGIGLGVYALIIGGGSQSRTGSGTPVGAAAMCRASQLSATVGFEGATGSMVGGTTITNTSRNPCSFPSGRPTVTVSWHGTPMPVQTRTSNPQGWPNWKPTGVLRPGGHSEVLLQWWNYCGPDAGRTGPTFELRLAQLVLRATAHETRPPFCNASGSPSRLYVSPPLTPG